MVPQKGPLRERVVDEQHGKAEAEASVEGADAAVSGDEANLEFEFETIGEKLARHRQRAGLSLEDIAQATKVRVHHLSAIENADYGALPGRPYAIGFAKAYARAVGMDDEQVAEAVRRDLDQGGSAMGARHAPVDLVEPSKVPSARLAWMAALGGLLLIAAGYGVWRSFFFPAADVNELASAAEGSDSLAAPAPAPAPRVAAAGSAPATAGPATDGPVVFTAQEAGVWVKFYDGEGKQLLQKQMALGEQFELPADVQDPQIWTGRPDAFAITIGGVPVPPLRDTETTIKDVPVSAEALLSRTTVQPALPANGGSAPPGDATSD